jgi:hypothetical protein
MARSRNDMTRGNFLGSTIALPAFVVLANTVALADGQKTSQASVHYQSTPSGSKQCSGCRFFTAGTGASSDGTCQIVEGSISANGYCDSYAAKS